MWDEDVPPPRGGGEADELAGPRTAKAKAGVVLVVTLLMLATLVLCCMGIATAARLIEVSPAHF